MIITPTTIAIITGNCPTTSGIQNEPLIKTINLNCKTTAWETFSTFFTCHCEDCKKERINIGHHDHDSSANYVQLVLPWSFRMTWKDIITLRYFTKMNNFGSLHVGLQYAYVTFEVVDKKLTFLTISLLLEAVD